jgi:hypothetical protein
MAGLYRVTGTEPVLAQSASAGVRDLRIRPGDLPDSRGVAVASLTARLALPFTLRLGFASVSPALYGFAEAAEPYDEVAQLAQSLRSPRELRSWSTGGGLLLALSPPISLTVEIGLGFSPRTGEYSFIVRLP